MLEKRLSDERIYKQINNWLKAVVMGNGDIERKDFYVVSELVLWTELFATNFALGNFCIISLAGKFIW